MLGMCCVYPIWPLLFQAKLYSIRTAFLEKFFLNINKLVGRKQLLLIKYFAKTGGLMFSQNIDVIYFDTFVTIK